MEKRVILAIALSLLILLSWSAFVSKMYHIDNKEVKQYNTPQPPLPKESLAVSVADDQPLEEALFTLKRENYEVVFSERRADIQEVKFLSYQSHKIPLKNGLLLGDKNLVFKREENLPRDTVSFVYEDSVKKITKRFTFSNYKYDIWLEINVANLSQNNLKFDWPLVLGIINSSSKNNQANYQDITVATRDKILRQNARVRKTIDFPETKFIGLRDRYFCAILEPESSNWASFIRKLNPQEIDVGIVAQELNIAPGQQIGQKFHLYIGPQDIKFINVIKPEWSAIIHYGTFDFISQLLLQLLEFLYRLTHSLGLAIIALSVTVYFVLYPLTLKQMRSMKEMQLLQPKIEELRKNYKDNPQKLNKEIMELYKQHKVNPFGGCIPLILQIPIFFALYQALIRSIALKGAKFLWIKDLSEPDRFFSLPTTIPIIGNEINILPILMAIGMFVQQKISMSKVSSGSAEQQKMMMILMPIMFGVIFYHMPSGLVLYWFVNSALMLVYQIRISKTNEIKNKH